MLDPDIKTLALFKGACRREIDEPVGPRGGQSKTVLKAIIVGRERAYITTCFPGEQPLLEQPNRSHTGAGLRTGAGRLGA